MTLQFSPLSSLNRCIPTLTGEKGRQECDERTRKKAEKRKRRKQAKREGQHTKRARTSEAEIVGEKSEASGGSGSGGGGSDEDAVEEFVYIPVADQAASGGDGGAPAAYKNDGSFLEKMKAELGGAGSGGGQAASGN